MHNLKHKLNENSRSHKMADDYDNDLSPKILREQASNFRMKNWRIKPIKVFGGSSLQVVMSISYLEWTSYELLL